MRNKEPKHMPCVEIYTHEAKAKFYFLYIFILHIFIHEMLLTWDK